MRYISSKAVRIAVVAALAMVVVWLTFLRTTPAEAPSTAAIVLSSPSGTRYVNIASAASAVQPTDQSTAANAPSINSLQETGQRLAGERRLVRLSELTDEQLDKFYAWMARTGAMF
jgi:hypothetical protein